MSDGSKIVPVRMPDELHLAVLRALESRNARTADRPWTVSDWVRAAVGDKLKHLARGNPRTSRQRPNASENADTGSDNLAATAQQCGMTPAELVAHLDRQDALLAELMEGGPG